MLLWGILLVLICGCLISLLYVFVEETKGIILSVAGAILFLLGIHIVGIILVIAGIIVYNYAKDSDKKANIEKLKKYHQQKMYSLVEQCWNSKTCDFNWSLWIDKKDEIFYDDSDLELQKTAQAELQSLGKAQINMLNMYLDLMTTEHRKDFAMKEIKAKERIVLNLEDIFSEPFHGSATNSLLREVHQYRQDLYDYVLYKRKPLNQAKLSSMIKRGQAIISAK
mgnify:FL=1